MKRNTHKSEYGDVLRFTFHLLLVWLLTLPAISPLIQPTITHSADGLLHLYRLVALDQALQQGAFFPRWLPDLAFGYGFPLFVFYAPLSYYVTLALHLAGADLISAFNASFALAISLSGFGAFLLVNDRFGPRAGILAAVAYVYAPFQLFNVLSRGGLPAAWAMALYPFVFWAFGRLLRSAADKPLLLPWSLISAIIFGFALLSHNTLTLLFGPLLGLFLALELLACFAGAFRASKLSESPSGFKARPCSRAALNICAASLLGVGLAAFFLIPAITEKEYAQVARVITSPDFDFRFHFIAWRDLLALPQPANTGLLNPKFPLTLGLAQLGLAAGALLGMVLTLVRHKRLTRNDSPHSTADPVREWAYRPASLLLFALLSLLASIFMMLSISRPVWELLPLIEFVQFPHRLLGPAALMLAILAGAAVAFLPERHATGFVITGIIVIFITAVPLLYPRYNPNLPTPPTFPDMMAYERASGVIGTTSFGEYLPIWVIDIPRESPLEPMYSSNSTIERLDPAYLPPEANIESITYGFNQAEAVIDAPEPYQAIFHIFYFPGWTAKIDGQPVPVAPFSERGLIRVDVPAGQHRLQLFFQETPLRQAANAVSVISLAALLILPAVTLVQRLRRTSRSNQPFLQSAIRIPHSPIPNPSLTRSECLILLSLALILIAAKTFYLDRVDNPLKRTFEGRLGSSVDNPQRANLGNQINFLGYKLGQSAVRPGQSFQLIAYWQARRLLATDYSALAQLVDSAGHLYAGQDNLHPGNLPSSQWQSWGFVRDSHELMVLPGTPPGDYLLVTGLYDPGTWQRLPVLQDEASAWSDVIAIPVSVLKPLHPPTRDELRIAWPKQVDFGPELRLLGATPERESNPRNDFLRVAIFWEALTKPTIDYQISLRLIDSRGNAALQQTNQPSHNRYPTTRWSSGERIRDHHALWIPADFPAGEYDLQMRVLTEADQSIGEWTTLGEMKIVE